MHPIFVGYLERLQALHQDILQAIAGLPAEALDWAPAPGANSIAVLIAHTAGAERHWIGERAGRRTVQRDRTSEFAVKAQDAATLAALLDESLALAAGVLEELALEDLTRPAGGWAQTHEVDAAWALWHALEHTAQHSGHIQLTRQWWDAQQP